MRSCAKPSKPAHACGSAPLRFPYGFLYPLCGLPRTVGQPDADDDHCRTQDQGEVDGFAQEKPAEKDAAHRDKVDKDRCPGRADCQDALIIPEKSEDRSKKTEVENAKPIYGIEVSGQAGKVLQIGRQGEGGPADEAGVCDRSQGRKVLHDHLTDQGVSDPARNTAQKA